jgi:hypothetical protein
MQYYFLLTKKTGWNYIKSFFNYQERKSKVYKFKIKIKKIILLNNNFNLRWNRDKKLF